MECIARSSFLQDLKFGKRRKKKIYKMNVYDIIVSCRIAYYIHTHYKRLNYIFIPTPSALPNAPQTSLCTPQRALAHHVHLQIAIITLANCVNCAFSWQTCRPHTNNTVRGNPFNEKIKKSYCASHIARSLRTYSTVQRPYRLVSSREPQSARIRDK